MTGKGRGTQFEEKKRGGEGGREYRGSSENRRG